MASDDNHFGPHLPGVFDFTLLFEQSILSLLPTALFILVTPLRVIPLIKRVNRVQSSWLLWAKCATIVAFGCLQVALVSLWSLSSAPKARTSIAEPAVAVIEAFAIGALSYSEHVKSTKPSALLNCYLVLTIILDIALTRTFWIRSGIDAIAGVFTASLIFKTILLVLEEVPKTPFSDDKSVSRETSAGVISRGVFWWLNRFFYLGARNLLTIDDLQAINPKFDSDKLLATLEEKWRKDTKESPIALLKCTFGAYKWQFFAGVIPRILHTGFNYAQPFLIRSVIIYVGTPENAWSGQVSSGLIGATVLIYIGRAISGAWFKHMSYQMVTMWRGGLVSLIYKKTLSLKAAAVKDNAPVTLMTTDIDTIMGAGETVHDLWSSVVELPIGIYILYQQVGGPSLFILIPTLVTTVMTGLIAPAMEPATVAWNAAIQKRVGEASNMLNQMKSIKMMGLTDYFHNLVRQLRIDEIKVSDRMRWLLTALITLSSVSYEIAPMIVILGAIYWTKAGEGLTITEAFTSLSIISLATQPLIMIITSLTSFAGVFGGFMRIQAYLMLEEQQDSRSTPRTSKALESSKSDTSLNRQTNSAQGPDASEMDVLPHQLPSDVGQPAIFISNATFRAEDGTELLKDIDMTIRPSSINMIVSRVGGGKSCLLKAMIGELVPESGLVVAASHSSAYCDQTPWLLNTTIKQNVIGQSLYDEEWYSTVFEACALNKDASMLPKGDATIVGSGGVALSGGQKQRLALARAVYSRNNLVILDDVFSGLDSKTSRKVFQSLLGANGLLRKSKTTVVLSTSNPNLLPAADYITMLETGQIVRNQVTYDSLSPSDWGALAQEQEEREEDEEAKTLVKQQTHASEIGGSPLPHEADLTRQTGDSECYVIYLRSLGWGFAVLLFAMTTVSAGIEVMPRVWLKIWTENQGGSKDPAYTGGYIAFVLASVTLATFSLGLFLIAGIPRSATHLHESLLRSVCRAPLYFFTTTDSGTTLNRFSQDMTLVDQVLPISFYMTLMLVLRAIAQTGIVASGATYVAAFIPAVIVALYFVQKYYLRTSRQMRFLDLEYKSPLYTHFTETLAGVSTIRAFGWSSAFMDENARKLNISQKPFYLMTCIQRWLEVVLDLFIAGLALVLVSIALRVSGASSQGAIGLALVNLLDFSQTLTLVIDQWTQLETSLGAIARLKWFVNNTPDENKEPEKENPSADWPAQGAIEFANVSASYSEGTKTVLQDVSLRIEPGQKVGVCGRSGSGKSSLVLTLLRLLEIQSGSITIDGVDIATLPRQHVRSHLSTTPQDPISITGTVRSNLDPESTIDSDHLLIAALTKTQTWPLISDRGGLDATVADLGLSAGQQQLFSLARALLSRGKIVLLDEPTSSVDHETDREVRRRVLAREMQGRTVVEVAHRLEVVRDFDVVVVMGEGRVLEVGRPEVLLARESELRSLWRSQGANFEGPRVT